MAEPERKKGGKSVAYVCGVWDLFHDGHKNLIDRALSLIGEQTATVDNIVVGVHTDEFAVSYKRRPFQTQDQRASALSKLGCVPRSRIVFVDGSHKRVASDFQVTHTWCTATIGSRSRIRDRFASRRISNLSASSSAICPLDKTHQHESSTQNWLSDGRQSQKSVPSRS